MKVFHGKIISLDRVNSLYEYLVEEDGRIVYVGDSLPDVYGGVKEIIELGSRVLIPSFGDGHLHFSNWAMFAIAYFDVREAGDISGIQNIIRQNLKIKKYKAIIAFGISKHSLKEKRLITREELDDVCSHIPLTIVCYDGHSAVCNSKMMEIFPEDIQSLNGFHNANGHLFHEAFQEGTDYITKLVPPITLIKSIISAYDLLAEKGIGMIHATEGVGFPGDLDITLVSTIAKAQAERNNFQTRLFFQTLDVGKALKRKLPRIGGCFATAIDGCLGLCDAALHKPYTNNLQNKGIFFQDEYEVFNFIKNANRAGLQVEMHAIGDAAVSRAVNGIEAALMDYPRENHRHTIIHASLITPDDLAKMARLGIGITLQPGFLISPLEPVNYLKEILGNRVKGSSPIKTIMKQGVHISGGSDAPVIWPDPIEGIYGACNHPYNSEQSVSIVEALKMFTYEIARTCFDENERGSLEKGKIADMVILNQNPLVMNPKDLRTLKVEKLFLSGKAYQPGMGILRMLWNSLKGRKQKI